MTAAAPSHDIKLEFLQLQQECDFALWRAREANAEVKKAFARHLAGDGEAPSHSELAAIAELERHAEDKYRALRQFLRDRFT
jgi:hypothetical protein